MSHIFADIKIIQTCWEYFILGIIQGITEFLPISSTAHLKVLPILFGWDDPGFSISAAIQLGSIIAVIIYFREDLRKIINGISQAFYLGNWKSSHAQLGIGIIQGTLPILFAGIGIKLFLPNFDISPLRSIPSISFFSIIMALFLAYGERIGKRRKNITDITGKDSLFIGFGQMLAIIPGVSRSGITLTTALIHGFKRKDAARFSFLLGIPAISISGLVEFKKAFSTDLSSAFLPLTIGIITSAFVSWIAIDWIIKYLEKSNTQIFIMYRLIFGVTLIIWWLNFQYH